jgi:hypothetical protein
MTEESLHGQPFGFTERWFSLGLVPKNLLDRMRAEWNLGEDPNPEHYRYKAFKEFLVAHRPLSPELAAALFELGAADPDRAMGGAMMADIVRLPECPEKVLRAERWRNFCRRADFAPAAVYRHQTGGWEYIPVHPFGDEPENLARLGVRPESCWRADAWWGIEEDATLLESSIARVARVKPGLYARKTEHREGWVYLRAVFEQPFVTRQAFEEAMARFAALGFPSGKLFQLRSDQMSVWLAEVASP